MELGGQITTYPLPFRDKKRGLKNELSSFIDNPVYHRKERCFFHVC
ncbi:hypothetical protein M093_2023 [Bacteroides uniformis str. 3978 T3 i]|uniref:Uncharacterized protein n=1 Tax=Bacteroides uniformis str. 3978 T3 ii TaxID=1339349 RepID=A0A078RYP5_BACUN|nr:hypothetical protein M094_1284 [Bacteroides uniformis str. 3978 T3 ii]KDS59990.1 hypothetical protein M093_2023 [Bacteroides uniformis str. 3978 T3 i]